MSIPLAGVLMLCASSALIGAAAVLYLRPHGRRLGYVRRVWWDAGARSQAWATCYSVIRALEQSELNSREIEDCVWDVWHETTPVAFGLPEGDVGDV